MLWRQGEHPNSGGAMSDGNSAEPLLDRKGIYRVKARQVKKLEMNR